jgi:hypothetical protein
MEAVSDPVAFGLARLAEEELTISHAGPTRTAWLTLRDADGQMLYTTVAEPVGEEGWVANGDLIADPANVLVMYDSARELRDIGNKRAILAEHKAYDCLDPAGQRCDACVGREVYPNGVAVHQAWPCLTVRRLIARWDDHPDYRAEEWKP